MKQRKPVAIIFVHSKKEFETAEKLREWLTDEKEGLKSDGKYYVAYKGRTRPKGLAPTNLPESIPKGSVVLFRFKREIHGDALVKAARNTTKQERTELRKKYKRNYLVLIRFDPNFIRLYPKGAVTDKDLTDVLGKPPGFQIFHKLSPEKYLEVLSKAVN